MGKLSESTVRKSCDLLHQIKRSSWEWSTPDFQVEIIWTVFELVVFCPAQVGITHILSVELYESFGILRKAIHEWEIHVALINIFDILHGQHVGLEGVEVKEGLQSVHQIFVNILESLHIFLDGLVEVLNLLLRVQFLQL